MNNPEVAPARRFGVGPFGAIAAVIVIAMVWGLLAIDGLIASAADEQREAAADYLEAIAQHSIDALTLAQAPARDRMSTSVERAMSTARAKLAAAAIVMGPGDTIFIPRESRGTMDLRRAAHRVLRVESGPSAELLVAAESKARDARARLWVIGVLGILLLGLAVARERRQSQQVAARSADIERLSTEALRANAMKSEFLANVSHELRTPLTAIVGFVEMLRDGVYGELAPRQVGPVDRIAASATHLRQLVDQILDIARIAAGRLEVSREVISLRPYVLNIASDLESLFNERSLRLSISVPVTLPRIRTDPTHLRHILVNLLGNAVKYTPAGNVSVRARLVGLTAPGARRTSDELALLAASPNRAIPWVALQVADTGLGVPDRDRERIFDEFEQVNAGPRTDSVERGTGLGLAISRRLARALGGDITLESEMGKGSTFTMWIPVEVADLQGAVVGTFAAGRDTTPTPTS